MCYSFPMVLVAQQPHYLPWLGYFDLFARADAFVFLDSVQWIRQGRQHRTRLIGANGKPFWLTIPVESTGHREKKLKDMTVDQAQSWARRHWESVRAVYGKAPEFRTQVEPLLRPYFEKVQKEKFLVDVTQEGLFLFWEAFNLKADLHWSSDLPEHTGRNERLIALCQHFGAEEYYSSLGSTRYLDMGVFREAGIRVRWQHFNSTYPGDPLRPIDVSLLDWVAHFPFDEIRRKLRTGAPEPTLESYASLDL